MFHIHYMSKGSSRSLTGDAGCWHAEFLGPVARFGVEVSRLSVRGARITKT